VTFILEIAKTAFPCEGGFFEIFIQAQRNILQNGGIHISLIFINNMKISGKILPVGLAAIAIIGTIAVSAPAVSALQKKTWTGTASAISGSNITLAAKNGTSYTVDASGAKFVRRFGAAMQLADMQTGDMLRVQGTLGSDKTTITASTIRDMSLQAHNGTFAGKVASVGGSSFVMDTMSRGQQTINTSASTVFKLDGKSGQFSDLAPGLNVTVQGVWDRTASTVAANRVNITKYKAVRVTGAVTAVSGMTVSVHTSKGVDYQVDVTGAKITNKTGGTITAADLMTGDKVTVSGKLLVNSANITASKVRDLTR
jgi:hypothetical protein